MSEKHDEIRLKYGLKKQETIINSSDQSPPV
jgi:hypothetical protein